MFLHKSSTFVCCSFVPYETLADSNEQDLCTAVCNKVLQCFEPYNGTSEPATKLKSTAVLPYFKGLSEQLRRCLQQQGVRAVFKSETTLRSHLVRPKDAVDSTKQDGVVYIGETGRPMQDRIKEHDRDIRLARTQTSAVAEHTNNTGHYPFGMR
ncbi:hypothetical protein ACROYT_G005337 [Oculina patagonica]